MSSQENNRPVGESPTFYVTGGTIPRDAPCYVHRKADDDLYERLTAGDFCYVLTARQLGKSSLMVRTASRLREDDTLCIILDLTAVGHNVDVSRWYAGLVNQLGQHAGLEDEIDDFWLSPSQLGPMQRWMQALQQIVLKRALGRVVVFVDEIDAVRSLPFSADEFFAGIRECYNRRTTEPELCRLGFCLLGVATPSDLIKDTRITPFNIGTRIELTDFTTLESRQLIAGLAASSSGAKQGETDGIVDRVLYWSGGHPYLTQRLFRAIAEHPSGARASNVDIICKELFFLSRSRERDDNLHFVRERILRSEADPIALLGLYRAVRSSRKVPDDESNWLINVLRLSGIIRIVNGRLLVRNRIYSTVFSLAWIADNMPDAEVRRQRIAYQRGVVRTASVAGSIALAMTMLAAYAVIQKRSADRNAAIANRNERSAQQSAALATANAALATRIAGERDSALKEALTGREAAVASAAAARTQAERAKKLEARALDLAHRASRAESEAQRAARTAREESDMKAHYLYIADMSLLGEDWNSISGVPMDRVSEILSETSRSKVRGFEWGYWNRLAHRYRASFEPNSGWIYSADFSPDGKMVSTAGDDGTIRLWDVGSQRFVRSLHAGQNIHGVAYSQDGRRLVTAGSNGLVQIWNCSTDTPVSTMKVDYFPSKAIFLCNDTRILSWGQSNSAILWDAGTGAKIAELKGHTGEVTDAVCCANIGSVFTGSADGSIKRWNAETGAFEKTVFSGANHPILCVSADARGTLLAVSDSRSVKLVDVKTKIVLGAYPLGTGAVSVAMSPDGKLVAIADFSGVINIYTCQNLTHVRELRAHVGRVFSLCFSHDSQRLCSAGEDGTARVWDLNSLPDIGLLSKGINGANTASWSPDGVRIAVGYLNGSVGIWNVSSGSVVFTRPPHTSPIWTVGWSRDGSQVISCDQAGNVVTSVAVNGELASSFNVSVQRMRTLMSAKISLDGRYLWATYGNDSALCWERATGRQVLEIGRNQRGRPNAAFMHDSRFLVVGSDYHLTLWDISRRAQVKVWHTGFFAPSSIDVSTDGKHLVTLNGWAATVFSITPTGLTRDRVLRGHMAKAYNVAFSPDGTRIISSGYNAAVRLWDTSTGREVLNIQNMSTTFAASFSPDGTKIAAPGSTGVAIWYGTGN